MAKAWLGNTQSVVTAMILMWLMLAHNTDKRQRFQKRMHPICGGGDGPLQTSRVSRAHYWSLVYSELTCTSRQGFTPQGTDPNGWGTVNQPEDSKFWKRSLLYPAVPTRSAATRACGNFRAAPHLTGNGCAISTASCVGSWDFCLRPARKCLCFLIYSNSAAASVVFVPSSKKKVLISVTSVK